MIDEDYHLHHHVATPVTDFNFKMADDSFVSCLTVLDEIFTYSCRVVHTLSFVTCTIKIGYYIAELLSVKHKCIVLRKTLSDKLMTQLDFRVAIIKVTHNKVNHDIMHQPVHYQCDWQRGLRKCSPLYLQVDVRNVKCVGWREFNLKHDKILTTVLKPTILRSLIKSFTHAVIYVQFLSHSLTHTRAYSPQTTDHNYRLDWCCKVYSYLTIPTDKAKAKVYRARLQECLYLVAILGKATYTRTWAYLAVICFKWQHEGSFSSSWACIPLLVYCDTKDVKISLYYYYNLPVLQHFFFDSKLQLHPGKIAECDL